MVYLNHSSIGANPVELSSVEKVPEFLGSSCPNADAAFKNSCAHTEEND